MDIVFQLLVFAISLESVSLGKPDVSSIVMCVSDDMDEKFFAQFSTDREDLHMWRSDSRRLVVTADNPLRSLSFMEAPKLEALETFPNSRLEQLMLRYCPLERLVKPLYNLLALNMLKIENCRMRGTFNLAELLPLQNLTTLSLEANQLTAVILKLDEASNATERMSSSRLEVLNLCSNRIEHFDLDVLRTFPGLKELLLQRNKIVRIAGSVYLPALVTLHAKQNLLSELNLTGCNCSSLLSVYASQNKLSNFPLLGDTVSGLQVLDLNYNQLTSCNATELKKQPNLSTLLISNNALKSFSIENNETVELPSLKVLDLHGNQIEVLDLRGWQMPSLFTLIMNVNPLIALPDDLHERFPKLAKFSCHCADIDCEWIQRHVQHVRSGRFEMSVAWQGPKELSEEYRCVTVPYIGCVRCPFKRKRSTTTERVSLAD